MKQNLSILLGVLATLALFTLWVLIFTTPFWLVWNYILSVKFGIPTFTFAEAFFVAIVIKALFTIPILVQTHL